MAIDSTKFTDDRLENIAILAGDGCSPSIVEDYIEFHWDNQEEHDAWIATATDEEIADWIAACRK